MRYKPSDQQVVSKQRGQTDSIGSLDLHQTSQLQSTVDSGKKLSFCVNKMYVAIQKYKTGDLGTSVLCNKNDKKAQNFTAFSSIGQNFMFAKVCF